MKGHMNVIFEVNAQLKGKQYRKGHAVLADRLAYDAEFKELVKLGTIKVVSRSEAEQMGQNSKDNFAMMHARKLSKDVESDDLDAHEKAKEKYKKEHAAHLTKANKR